MAEFGKGAAAGIAVGAVIVTGVAAVLVAGVASVASLGTLGGLVPGSVAAVAIAGATVVISGVTRAVARRTAAGITAKPSRPRPIARKLGMVFPALATSGFAAYAISTASTPLGTPASGISKTTQTISHYLNQQSQRTIAKIQDEGLFRPVRRPVPAPAP